MSPEQVASIRRLESALRSCQENGIALCGMDDKLYAYDAERLEAANENQGDGRDLYEAQRRLSDTDHAVTVNDHGAYRESGGW